MGCGAAGGLLRHQMWRHLGRHLGFPKIESLTREEKEKVDFFFAEH